MAVYLKEFENHTQYDNYINGSGAMLPNVSICITEGDVHYNPYVPTPLETRLVAKFNVTSTSSPTAISFKSRYTDGTSGFSAIEIDGVEQTSVVSAYTFSTTGEHVVKYTLVDPTSIGGGAFNDCSRLISVTIPNSVTSIGGSAFCYCSRLTSIVIPDGVTSIGAHAFDGCSGLTSVTIPDSVTSIGFRAFYNCDSLPVENNIRYADTYAVMAVDKTLTNYTLKNNTKWIGTSAFYNCTGLTSIDIPSGVISIGVGAFQSCSSLTSINCDAETAPTIDNTTFQSIKTNGTLYVPIGSSGYDVWMGTSEYYLGYYNWTKVEQ